MKQTEIQNYLDNYGSVEFTNDDLNDILTFKLQKIYIDVNTYIAYNIIGISNLYNDMVKLYDDFVDEYPNLESYKNYFIQNQIKND